MTDLTVFIDFKSPYAYLAIPHVRSLAEELGTKVNWEPFVLDIPSYLGSARLGKDGKVAQQQRSASQWSGVKYAYYDCRRYANLSGTTIRGTEKIWDTNLAAVGMLWAKAQGDAILQAYLDAIYIPFWKRELDVEDLAVIEHVLSNSGASIQGFREFATGEGHLENQALQERAFDSGIFGVPTFELGGEQFFGREHLPRIRWLLTGKEGPPPDIAYELPAAARVEPAGTRQLTVALEPSAPESYLALEAIFRLVEDLDIDVRWHRLPASKQAVGEEDKDDNSRSARHKRYRANTVATNRARYFPPELSESEILEATETRLIDRGIDLASGEMLQDMTSRGFLGTPQFKLGEETFIGRQHLPLIRARFEAMNDV